jgi:uncharacterized protein (UPF0332 family)
LTERVTVLLARARQEIEAARVLAAAGFAAQSVSRAYYGVFYAAEAALHSIGETRSKHSGVIAAFGRLVVREGGMDPETARALRRLFELRNAADYNWLEAADIEPAPAVSDAELFIAAVADWIDRHA